MQEDTHTSNIIKHKTQNMKNSAFEEPNHTRESISAPIIQTNVCAIMYFAHTLEYLLHTFLLILTLANRKNLARGQNPGTLYKIVLKKKVGFRRHQRIHIPVYNMTHKKHISNTVGVLRYRYGPSDAHT